MQASAGRGQNLSLRQDGRGLLTHVSPRCKLIGARMREGLGEPLCNGAGPVTRFSPLLVSKSEGDDRSLILAFSQVFGSLKTGR